MDDVSAARALLLYLVPWSELRDLAKNSPGHDNAGTNCIARGDSSSTNLRYAPYDNNAPSFGSEHDRFCFVIRQCPFPITMRCSQDFYC